MEENQQKIQSKQIPSNKPVQHNNNNKFLYIIILFLILLLFGTSRYIILTLKKSSITQFPQITQPTKSIPTTQEMQPTLNLPTNINKQTILNGILVKKGWAKSDESYCAGGSDYFTLKTNSQEIVLDFEPFYSEAQMSEFSGKNVFITGEKKQRQKKIICSGIQQCPRIPDGVFTCEVFKIHQIFKPKCIDCGESGWQKMTEKCEQQIITKNDFKECLMKFSWTSVNQNTNMDEIKDGYIEIGGRSILEIPTNKSIEAFIFNQWAVDKDGNLYLLGQLG